MEIAAGDAGYGVYTLLWGLLATPFSLAVAIDFRGLARRLAKARPDQAEEAPRGSVRFLRVVGGVFTVAGAGAIVTGSHSVLQDRNLSGRIPAVPLPFVLLMAAALTLALVHDSRKGALGSAWRTGGRRRSGALLYVVGFAGFLAGLALGQVYALFASCVAAWTGTLAARSEPDTAERVDG
ncbi:hypothetical protein AB0M28_19230 [Streptomyces sp. NPDC051940]|uniref:hypothetical protein n=1 Tax=Streptomyces sp. NPDC051940 TaxID=3155675 RepID=UPI0034425C14